MDIAHAVQKLASRAQSPVVRDMVAAKRVLRYLSGTRGVGLLYTRNRSSSGLVIEGFSDADWANDRVDRKSISGWVIKLNGTAIAWSSKKHNAQSHFLPVRLSYMHCVKLRKRYSGYADY